MPRHRHRASPRARRKQTGPPDEQGQRLDAARATFRAEWQARVDRKRQQAARLRRFAEAIRNGIRRDPRRPFITGGCLGTAILGSPFLGHKIWPNLPFWMILGFIIGYLIAMLLTPGVLLVARLCHAWADRCEQSADRLEPWRRRNSR